MGYILFLIPSALRSRDFIEYTTINQHCSATHHVCHSWASSQMQMGVFKAPIPRLGFFYAAECGAIHMWNQQWNTCKQQMFLWKLMKLHCQKTFQPSCSPIPGLPISTTSPFQVPPTSPLFVSLFTSLFSYWEQSRKVGRNSRRTGETLNRKFTFKLA